MSKKSLTNAYYVLKNYDGKPSFEVINLRPSAVNLTTEQVDAIIKEKGLVRVKTYPPTGPVSFEIYA